MTKGISLAVLVLVSGMAAPAAAQDPAARVAAPVGAAHVPTQAEREAAKTVVLNALSADHRTKVLALIDRVNKGQLTDFHAARVQLDALLTPVEAAAVLAEHDKIMHVSQTNATADAGRFVLRLLISPEKLREVRLDQERRGGPE